MYYVNFNVPYNHPHKDICKEFDDITKRTLFNLNWYIHTLIQRPRFAKSRKTSYPRLGAVRYIWCIWYCLIYNTPSDNNGIMLFSAYCIG